MVSKKAVKMMVASAVALTIAGGVGSANAGKDGKEKCYGVSKAGSNDCGAADKSHSCAGKASVDGSANEWIYLPKGTCDKLAGGSLVGGEGGSGDMKMNDMKMNDMKKDMKDHGDMKMDGMKKDMKDHSDHGDMKDSH